LACLSFSLESRTMLRRLPPLNALKTFEAAARSESFTRAAEELSVTQAAVSQQIKTLETTLGIKLFIRERQRLAMTEASRDYLVVVRDALDRIAIGTDRLVQRQTSGVLTVSASPDFAAKWLVHRLGRFAEAHPDIDLRVSATVHHVDFAREDVDLAVRHGDGHWAGLDAVRLCTEQLFPVCSPKLVSGRNRITRASDLLKFPLLRLDDWKTWSRWFDAAGVNAPLTQGPVLNRASMLIDAAIDGQGVALARTALAAWDLISRRLVRPIDVSLRMSNTYWIVCPKATSAVPKVATFRDWLSAEAAEDMRRLKALP
jgi:LysR family glycine cleavage system transcriptional activator